MLILVGVTINVALNGGLFETTKSAVSETEKMAILEEIIEMTKWNNKGEVDVEATKTSVEAKYPGAVWDEATGKLTIAGKRGTYEYKISKREIKNWSEKETENPDTPENPDNPTDNKKLVYNKIYSATIEGMTIEVAFSDKYNIVIGNCSDTSVMSKYSYNEETKELNKLSPTWMSSKGEYFELSDDGKVIFKAVSEEDDGTTQIVTVAELELTERSISELYTTQENPYGSLYEGIYYCENTKEAIYFYSIDEGTAVNDFNTLKPTAWAYAGPDNATELENYLKDDREITILSKKSISYNGETYTLLESLE